MKKKVNNVLTLIIAIAAILLFMATLITIWFYSISHFSLVSLLSGIFASIIPGLLVYSLLIVTIQFVKDTFLN